MGQTSICIRIDSELKEEFSKFCSDVGLTMSSAITLFAKKAVKEYRIPFEIDADKPE